MVKSELLYQEWTIKVNGRSRSLDFQWDCADKFDRDFETVHGELVDNGYKLTVAERQVRSNACSGVKTIWFLLWISPFLGFLVNLVIAMFCAINSWTSSADDTSKAEKALKQFISLVVILCLCTYVASSIAGASMRFTGVVMAFCGGGLVALFIWIYFEVGAKMINSTLRNSKIMASLVTIVTHDFFRAWFVLCFNVFLPAMVVIEVVKQKVRRLRGTTTSEDWLTPEGRNLTKSFYNWKWTSILIKVNWLAILYWTFFVGVSKLTVVFLAWLNQELYSVPFYQVLMVFFVTGYIMFMLPPVPGIPVYITSGIIIGAQGRELENVGYVGGIVIAVLMSLCLKILACCGQYGIGYALGKSVKVQQFVGVDKVPTRAIEEVLLVKGLGIGKVAVLVGGPDWPTSVMCGILRLNLFQVCWGTMPVILVSAPCVLAGAFLSGPSKDLDQAEKSLWDAIANAALATSAMGQLASGVLALYYIQDMINKNSEMLARDRPEHEAVKQLTLDEAEFNRCYEEVTDWRLMPRKWFLFISTSCVFSVMAFAIFMLMDESCFVEFQVKSNLTDPEGLNCETNNLWCGAIRIVKPNPPIGWIGLFFFTVGAVMHVIFLKWAGIAARRLMSLPQRNSSTKM